MLDAKKTVDSLPTVTTNDHSLTLLPDDLPANHYQILDLPSTGCGNIVEELSHQKTSHALLSSSNKNGQISGKQRRRIIQKIRMEISATEMEKNQEVESSDKKQNTPDEPKDENTDRGNWSGRYDFKLCCLGCAVGLGNVWRFPYLCFANGGGAFLIPYTIFLFLCGIPLFLIEVSLGQFTSEGPTTCWELAPILGGIGYSMLYLSTIIAIYYNMIISYAIYYMFASMARVLPWSHCKNSWNTGLCREELPVIPCSSQNRQPNGTCLNGTEFLGIYDESLFNKVNKTKRIMPSEEYFYREVLKRSHGLDEMGAPDWKLVLCLLIAWFLVFVCLINGIKSAGKVAYFTALFPYVLLLIMFFRGVTLKDAGEGIKYYLKPDFRLLSKASVWIDAAGQIFFSLSCSVGSLISLSSYNRFHNNIIRDTFFVTITNCATSVFAGFVIFSFIGHLAGSMKVPIAEIAESGMGLAFVIYPAAMKVLPGSNLWSIIFFLMLLTLGIDSQFAMVETVVTSICDSKHSLRRHRPTVVGLVCLIMFLLGLPLTCPGGFYLLTILDKFGANWMLLMLGLIECIIIGWIYGRPGLGKFHRFSEDIKLMMRAPIWCGWRYMWQYVTPVLIFCVMLANWISYSRTEYKKGSFYPIGAELLGWLITFTSVFIILVIGLAKLFKEHKEMPWGMRLFNLSIPSYIWGPALPKNRNLMAPYMHQLGALRDFFLYPGMFIKYKDVYPLYDGRRRTLSARHNQQSDATGSNPDLHAAEANEETDDEQVTCTCSDATTAQNVNASIKTST